MNAIYKSIVYLLVLTTAGFEITEMNFLFVFFSFFFFQMEQTCDDIDEMFSNLLGEMDMLTQVSNFFPSRLEK